ncbi:energy-coupling factor ABC transporter ATP-binding protein [Paenibacillus profundus]|uniref:Energy-coupling factor ABC transporter ATP-binding protein n=1 Tax=Paenibacillus profundus TaxID=1173085 RepID=A0ABS8YSM7_9BACL|nr:ABC transporter ATP-binding protein [Paenibacillus profundus]MCE5173355.1 energy-coupling factor ABC transporter ATP-binding protein [Paenibacillus profundus]
MIEMHDVHFTYAGTIKPVLDGIDVMIGNNETVLLLGASGAGKSSLVLCLNGLIPNSIYGEFSGVVRVGGKDTSITPIAELARQVGIVFQDPEAQLVTMKVEDEVAFGMENLCLGPNEMERRIEVALQQTGLSEFRQWQIDKLSGGQKQRLALASVLCMQPRILVLDEPTANLDPEGTRELFAILRNLRKSGNYTIIMIEHKLDDLMDMADRVLVLGKNGRIIADGHPREVFYHKYNELIQEGVWLPYSVTFTCELIKRGIAVSGTPLTVNETVEMLERIRLTGENDEFALQAAAGIASRMNAEAVNDTAHTFVGKIQPSLVKDELAIEIRPVEFTQKKACILRPMHLCVPKGDFLAIVGKNGAGKSTLARYMIKLQQADKGVIYLHGRDLVEWPVHDMAREVGYVFQNPEHQFVTNRVFDELAFGLKGMQLSPDEIYSRVEQMLDRFGLKKYIEANPFQLSHGEKRRLSTASMLITGQRLLILDEPTFGQDGRNAHQLMQLMKELQETGHTIIIISHDMGLIAEYADHAAVLKTGRLIFHGTVQALFDRKELLVEAGLNLPPSVEIERQFRAASV